MAEKCLPDLVKGIAVPSFETLRREALNLYVKPVSLPKRVKNKKAKRYLTKAERVYNLIKGRLNVVKRIPKWSSIHPFYKELLNIGGVVSYEENRWRILRMLHTISDLWINYRNALTKSVNGGEAKNHARNFVGRSLSIAKKLSKDLEVLNRALNIIKLIPCINPNEPFVVIAGMPQTGKSTLVSRVSTAKPKISTYPFTTKNVILGHLRVTDYLRIQIMDTPGILDRPLEKLNEIERRAIAAINHLATVVLFLIDPREDSYYPLEEQLNVYQTIKSLVDKDRVFIVINKIDSVNEERLNSVLKHLRRIEVKNVATISALKGYGVKELIYAVLKKLNIEMEKEVIKDYIFKIHDYAYNK